MKCRWFVIASWTSNLQLGLSNHQICHYRLVSAQVSGPTLSSHLFVGSVIALNGGFFQNSVQILVQTINQEGKEFLGIMLRIAWKNGVDATHSWFEGVRSKNTVRVTPHSFDKFSVILSQLSLSSQRIHFVHLFCVEALEEVVSQRLSVGQTLKATVHEAGISEISQSNKSPWAAAGQFHLHWLVQFFKFSILTISKMEAFVFVFAILWAVCHFLALTGKFKISIIIASLTFPLCFCLQKPTFRSVPNLNHEEIFFFHVQITYFYFVCQPPSHTSDAVLIVGPISSCSQVFEQRVESLFLVNFPKSPLCVMGKLILGKYFVNKILGDCILWLLNYF